MVEFMRAAGETRAQKHDKGNVDADADFDFVKELFRRRFLMTQLLSKIEPLLCRIAGELRIHVVDAVGVSSTDANFSGIRFIHLRLLRETPF